MDRKIKDLSYEDKLKLRNLLMEEIQSVDPEFDQHWLEIVRQRRHRMQTGQSAVVSLEEVLDELKPGV
jgi:hypothetical protein